MPRLVTLIAEQNQCGQSISIDVVQLRGFYYQRYAMHGIGSG